MSQAKEQLEAKERIAPDVLAMLQNARRALEHATLAHDTLAAQIVAHYKLSGADSIDLSTGEITRAEKE